MSDVIYLRARLIGAFGGVSEKDITDTRALLEEYWETNPNRQMMLGGLGSLLYEVMNLPDLPPLEEAREVFEGVEEDRCLQDRLLVHIEMSKAAFPQEDQSYLQEMGVLIRQDLQQYMIAEQVIMGVYPELCPNFHHTL